jgi:hypothetical protein
MNMFDLDEALAGIMVHPIVLGILFVLGICFGLGD